MRGPVHSGRVWAIGVLLIAAGAGAGGCRPSARATGAPPRPWPPEEHCWWAAFRTALPTDSVAARSARAYTTLGLSGARWAPRADPAWADAGPTVLAPAEGDAARYAARVVANRRGDAAVFRPFVSVTAASASRRSSAIADSTGAESTPYGREHIAFCGALSRATGAQALAPKTEEQDDTLPVWRCRPW